MMKRVEGASTTCRPGAEPMPTVGAAADTAAAPKPDFDALHGVRAIASIGVVFLHCYVFWQLFVSHQTKYGLTRRDALLK